MDVSPIIDVVISYVIWGVPLFILIGFFKTPWFKGWLGEVFVNLITRFSLDKKKYHLIKNVTLPIEDGSTQIDHVIVSRFGVFVVETKNMKGWIFGSAKQKMWTQQLFKKKFKFQNPCHQNYKHMKVLQALLGLEESQMFSLVVFVGDSTFKTKPPENVVRGLGYIRFIKAQQAMVFSDDAVALMVENIKQGRLQPSFKTHREHVKHVKAIVADKKLCKKCGSNMVKRVAKKGPNAGNEFWGCSAFPKCRATA